jgi:predicted nucleotidyltransferase
MTLSLAIFSDRQSRLFRWLFGQPDRSFHLNELIRLTGLSSASLQQELKRLTDSGLVASKRMGNLRMISANPNSPIFSELVSLTRKTCGLEAQLAQALTPIKNKLQHALIYGSVAKKEDTSSSDIDVMLVGDNLSLVEVLECLEPLESSLGRKVNPTCYSVREFEMRLALPDSFVSRVLAQPTINLLEINDGG